MKNGPDNGPDIEGMKRLIARRDREVPDVFVGREKIISALADDVRLLAASGGLRGATRIVQGAPGAGKTALLNELRVRWTSPRYWDIDPTVLEVSSESFSQAETLVAEISQALDLGDIELPGHGEATNTRGSINTRRSIKGGVADASRGKTTTRHFTSPKVTLAQLRERHAKDRRKPLVLLVDEAQEIVPDAERVDRNGERAPLNTSLAALHKGLHGLPILPVYFGLSTTRATLRAMSASRLAVGTTTELGPLPITDCEMGARETLRLYRPTGPEAELHRWARMRRRVLWLAATPAQQHPRVLYRARGVRGRPPGRKPRRGHDEGRRDASRVLRRADRCSRQLCRYRRASGGADQRARPDEGTRNPRFDEDGPGSRRGRVGG